MLGKKGMLRYSRETKELVVKAYQEGISIIALNRQYGISRYAIQSWCGLRKEMELRHAAPLPKGRPTSHPESQEQSIKRLRMENEFPQNFL